MPSKHIIALLFYIFSIFLELSKSKLYTFYLFPNCIFWLFETKFSGLRKKEAPKKRTPGSNPRIPFSESTLKSMEAKYQESPYITGDNLIEFAKTIHVSKERVRLLIFQNTSLKCRRNFYLVISVI